MTSRAQAKPVPVPSGSDQENSKKSPNASSGSSRIRIFAFLFVFMSLDVISYSAQLPLFPAILNHFYTYDREVYYVKSFLLFANFTLRNAVLSYHVETDYTVEYCV